MPSLTWETSIDDYNLACNRILTLTKRNVARCSVSLSEIDREVDDMAQNIHIKLWQTLQKRGSPIFQLMGKASLRANPPTSQTRELRRNKHAVLISFKNDQQESTLIQCKAIWAKQNKSQIGRKKACNILQYHYFTNTNLEYMRINKIIARRQHLQRKETVRGSPLGKSALTSCIA